MDGKAANNKDKALRPQRIFILSEEQISTPSSLNIV